MQCVKSHAKEYKVDLKRIALLGESAGGHLVSFVGAQNKPEARVAAVVSFTVRTISRRERWRRQAPAR